MRAAVKEEAAALEVVVCRGFWPEHRRWIAGRIGTATCEACGDEIGDDTHRPYNCEPLTLKLAEARRAGEYKKPAECVMTDKALRPLHLYGWLPIDVPWGPTQDVYEEGTGGCPRSGDAYGDGSGFGQNKRETRHAAWAVVRYGSTEEPPSIARGTVNG